MFSEEIKEHSNKISNVVIGAAIEVHKILGPGLLESAYEECLCREFEIKKVQFKRQVPLPVEYKGVKLDCSYRMDIIVEDLVILELKSVEAIDQIHLAQVLTYLRLSKNWLGLLINFNVEVLKNGIRRLVNG
jgi:GxxExxY protein